MINQLTDQEQFELMDQARQALNTLNEYKVKQKKVDDLITEGQQKATVGSQYFSPYDELIWEGKVKVDMLYYDQFLQKIEETEQIQKALGSYFKNIRELYEFVNLEPEIYGKNINFSILEESKEQVRQKISTVIYEYFDKNFYNLDTEKRTNKYFEQCREICKTLITEGADPDEVISFAIKTVVVENLLTKIAFPFASWSRIKYLTESFDYGQIFDQTSLIEHVESFERKTRALAKIIATVV